LKRHVESFQDASTGAPAGYLVDYGSWLFPASIWKGAMVGRLLSNGTADRPFRDGEVEEPFRLVEYAAASNQEKTGSTLVAFSGA